MNPVLAYPQRAVRSKPVVRKATIQREAMVADAPASKRFNNPNVPLECTQEEFVEYICGIEERIERGEFKTAEQSKKDFEQWRKALLASRI